MAITCPGCKTPMDVVKQEQGVEIDACPKCRGHWLDLGELDRLAPRPPERDNDLMDELGMHAAPNGAVVRRCPRCNRRLSAHQSEAHAKLRIDACSAHGVFLDEGELELIRELARTGVLQQSPEPETAAVGPLAGASPRANRTPQSDHDARTAGPSRGWKLTNAILDILNYLT